MEPLGVLLITPEPSDISISAVARRSAAVAWIGTVIPRVATRKTNSRRGSRKGCLWIHVIRLP